MYSTAGPDFGTIAGNHIVITQALYCLKSSGSAWRAHLAGTMTDLNFEPCQADYCQHSRTIGDWSCHIKGTEKIPL